MDDLIGEQRWIEIINTLWCSVDKMIDVFEKIND